MLGRRVISYLDAVTDVVSIEKASGYLNLARTDEDLIIESFIGAAINRCSNYCGFSLRRATVEYYFPLGTYHQIPANIISLTSVSYQSDKDTWNVMSTDDYYLDKNRHIPCLTIVNVPNSFYDYQPAYKVLVQEGYYVDVGGSVSDEQDIMPTEATQGILFVLGHLYGNRNDVNIVNMYQLPQGAEFFLHQVQKLHIV